MKKYNMLTDKPGRSLFFFALPMILGNLFQQFYTTVDSIIVGQFVGEDALAAVGASYSLTTVFIMIAIGGGIGASVITSQYLGAGIYRKMKTSVSTALISFLILSLVLSAIGLLGNRAILSGLLTCSPAFKHAGEYSFRCRALSGDLFPGSSLFVYVQYSVVHIQCPWQFQDAPLSAHLFFPAQYRDGSCDGAGFSSGRGGCRHSDGDRAGTFRRDLLLSAAAAAWNLQGGDGYDGDGRR